jgi:hypothetical protein
MLGKGLFMLKWLKSWWSPDKILCLVSLRLTIDGLKLDFKLSFFFDKQIVRC